MQPGRPHRHELPNGRPNCITILRIKTKTCQPTLYRPIALPLKNQTEFPFANDIRHDRYWWTKPEHSKRLAEQYKRIRQMPIVRPDPITFVLISCSKTKLSTPAIARELYTGQLFKKAVAWAERHQYRWFIVSALHGLVTPDQELDPYNFTIKDWRKRERESWAHQAIAGQLTRYASPGSHALLILPQSYRLCIQEELNRAAFTYENPVAGLAIGQQMQWLDSH